MQGPRMCLSWQEAYIASCCGFDLQDSINWSGCSPTIPGLRLDGQENQSNELTEAEADLNYMRSTIIR